ncbi:hypothetical protein GQ44DRAFT_704389 [Phaeosphaeriaceae sp. PMI808]|nr:hypothetical protein GQ44DRAFT_704389 [Phaeosphaeriaceae sp. PMI808]
MGKCITWSIILIMMPEVLGSRLRNNSMITVVEYLTEIMIKVTANDAELRGVAWDILYEIGTVVKHWRLSVNRAENRAVVTIGFIGRHVKLLENGRLFTLCGMLQGKLYIMEGGVLCSVDEESLFLDLDDAF